MKSVKKAVLLLGLILCVMPTQKGFAAENNEAEETEEAVFVPSEVPGPEFSFPAGFYEEAFSLSLSAESGSKIYYTLDGSVPKVGKDGTKRYSEPIPVRSNEEIAPLKEKAPELSMTATVVRAIAVDSDGKASDPVTATYFVSKDMKSRYDISVISLTADPDSFYGEENGIFTFSQEHGREWEREAGFEFFLPDGTRELCMNVGVRIHGGFSRHYSTPGLRIYAREEYDTQKKFKYDFFSDSILPAVEKNGEKNNITKFKRLILRTGGTEAGSGTVTFFRDVLAQAVMSGTILDMQAYRPAVIFINGEFYSLTTMRERMDEHYLSDRYNCKKDEIVIYEVEYKVGVDLIHPTIYEGDDSFLEDLEEVIHFVMREDISTPANYQKVSEYFDIDNFIDYVCMELYVNNTDWPKNNCRLWKYTGTPSDEYGLDGKLRWLVYDMDASFGMGMSEINNKDADCILEEMLDETLNEDFRYDIVSLILRGLMKNTEFKEKFLTRFYDLLNTRFQTQRVIPFIESLKADFQKVFHEQALRKAGQSDYDFNVGRVELFAQRRRDALVSYLKKTFSLKDSFQVKVGAAVDCGQVFVNTVNVTEECQNTAEWNGTYFETLPLTVKAVPAAGYVFDHWEGSDVKSDTIVIPAGEQDRNMTLIPCFTKSGTEYKCSTVTISDGKKKAEPTAVLTQAPAKQENDNSQNKDKSNTLAVVIVSAVVLLGLTVIWVIGEKKKNPGKKK